MIDFSRSAVLWYILFWLVRLNGCIRRGRQPLLRGAGWFFSVPVSPGFYSGAGRTLLHHFWLRMLVPFAIDIPIAILIWQSGRLVLLNWLIIGLVPLIHLHHAYSVALAERQARSLGGEAADEPVASLASSLETRRACDYANPVLEWALALSTAAALAWAWYHGPHALLGVPARLLYLQFGLLLVKRVIVAWPAPAPVADAAEHLAVREAARRLYLRVCDWGRVETAVALLYAVVHPGQPSSLWFAGWLAIGVAGTVWLEIERKRLVVRALRTRPVRLPDLMPDSGIIRWPICYQPSAPVLIVKGAHGYSLNLAHRLAHVSAAYLVGFAVVLVL
jgi:hypothetical protein